jgi:putative membrane protein
MSNSESIVEKKFSKAIIIVSILIPVVVAILFSFKLKDFGIDVAPLHFLPPVYATINGVTAVLLIAAVLAIKNGHRKIHENLMTTAIACSLCFLVMYVAYHLTTENTKFGDVNHDGVTDAVEIAKVGLMRILYFFILISHILLSIAIIPLVLFTYVRALSARFDKHKKLAKITFPIWLYVAITGVVIYLMISPYYAS